MKKIQILLFTGVALLCSCKKDSEPNTHNTPNKITISSVNNHTFNSTWQHVLAGKGILKFTPINENGKDEIVDSVNLSNIAGFSKEIIPGTYHISLNTKTTHIADTFIRFSAFKERHVINNDSKLAFTGETQDGLITISKDFVKENTIPTFTSSITNSSTIKFGLINGFYYLYVHEGNNGVVSFKEKTTGQSFIKNIAVTSKSQFDIVVNCLYSNTSLLSYKWINSFTEIKHYDNLGNVLYSTTNYPTGYFQINIDKSYNVYSNNVPLNGNWEINLENCQLILDKNSAIERSFKILKANSDSLIISRKDGAVTYIQHYYK